MISGHDFWVQWMRWEVSSGRVSGMERFEAKG